MTADLRAALDEWISSHGDYRDSRDGVPSAYPEGWNDALNAVSEFLASTPEPTPVAQPLSSDKSSGKAAPVGKSTANNARVSHSAPVAEGLDAAWAAAEAALPEGWALSVFRTFSGPDLGYGIEAAWTEPLPGDDFDAVDKRLFAHGPTPAAALRALAARLAAASPSPETE